MKRELRRTILHLLRAHRVMSLATVRADGYPQSTTVVYANEGLRIYFACDPHGQKVRNLARNGRVSLTIGREQEDFSRIVGLSMGGEAHVVRSPAERKLAWDLLEERFAALRGVSEEERAASAIVRVDPRVVSVVDYRRGYGHTDLVQVARA